jgi:transcriptional regulator with XRE-family HTH domain
MGSNNKKPYYSFGEVLKSLRSKASKTPAEVSGAVEIEESKLNAYERGEQRPSEDILLLLIQHFDLKDDQADELWKLAGYNQIEEEQHYINDEQGRPQEVGGIVDGSDTRILYTDMIQVVVNNYGVIVNFLQGAGPGNQPLAVSRIGMSKEHARSVLEVLKKTLDQAEIPTTPKMLKNPDQK